MSKMGDLIIEVNELLDSSVYCVADIAHYTGAPLSMVEAIVESRFDAACERSEYRSGIERAVEGGQLVLDL